MSRVGTLIVGTVAASVVPALLVTVFLALFDSKAVGSHPLVVLVVAALVCAAHAVVLGLPSLIALLNTGHFRFAPVLGAGFVVGALPSLALLALQQATHAEPGLGLWRFVQLAAATGGLGCIGAACFFAVTVRLLEHPNGSAA
jgi:hypothetical protein